MVSLKIIYGLRIMLMLFFRVQFCLAKNIVITLIEKENKMSDFKRYKCKTCGHIYDEEKGEPDSSVAAGTRWVDVPDDWKCPDCGAEKVMFTEMKQ